jgi:hypothetical protein
MSKLSVTPPPLADESQLSICVKVPSEENVDVDVGDMEV